MTPLLSLEPASVQTNETRTVRRRRNDEPITPKPMMNIAQVAGSGTAARVATLSNSNELTVYVNVVRSAKPASINPCPENVAHRWNVHSLAQHS
jgi:hypothetical protein